MVCLKFDSDVDVRYWATADRPLTGAALPNANVATWWLADVLELRRCSCHYEAMSNISVDFVAFDDDRDACLLVLVEEGWSAPVEEHLRSLQERFYGCLNAALDGQVADLFPNSQGRTIVIQVDCYGLPVDPIDEFVRRFASGVFEMSDYSPEGSQFVRAFQFEVNHNKLPT